MGLPWSIEKIQGWRMHYKGVLRWQARVENCYRDGKCIGADDAEDFLLAFFVFCYHLRDFVVETGGISPHEVDTLIQSDRVMKPCRDICNRAKHHSISKNTYGATWSLGREFPRSSDSMPGLTHFLIAAGEKYYPLDVVRDCIRFWSNLATSGRLAEPRNPFAQR